MPPVRVNCNVDLILTAILEARIELGIAEAAEHDWFPLARLTGPVSFATNKPG